MSADELVEDGEAIGRLRPEGVPRAGEPVDGVARAPELIPIAEVLAGIRESAYDAIDLELLTGHNRPRSKG
jgi:hypothetical protein